MKTSWKYKNIQELKLGIFPANQLSTNGRLSQNERPLTVNFFVLPHWSVLFWCPTWKRKSLSPTLADQKLPHKKRGTKICQQQNCHWTLSFLLHFVSACWQWRGNHSLTGSTTSLSGPGRSTVANVQSSNVLNHIPCSLAFKAQKAGKATWTWCSSFIWHQKIYQSLQAVSHDRLCRRKQRWLPFGSFVGKVVSFLW